MKVEEIAEAIAKLPPDQLARFRRWFTAFEAGRSDHAKELDSAATKLGRPRVIRIEKTRERTVSSERSPDSGLIEPPNARQRSELRDVAVAWHNGTSSTSTPSFLLQGL